MIASRQDAQADSKALRTKADQCLDHAEDLLSSAVTINATGMHHIAFHLGTLALEEIGKAGMMLSGAVSIDYTDDVDVPKIDNHVKKLFFAIWSPLFSSGPLDKSIFEGCERYATFVHRKRLEGLYVDSALLDMRPPIERVTKADLNKLLRLAKLRMQMERQYDRSEATDEEKEEIRWFLRIVRNTEDFKRIISSGSMTKLSELGSGRAWIAWLRQEYHEAEKRKQKYLEDELARKLPDSQSELKPKWRLRVRLYSESHLIKPKHMKHWPKAMNRIRPFIVDKKKPDQLFLEFVFNNSYPVHELWRIGIGATNHFLLALNIGTLGFFWWHPVRHDGIYYEKLTDLEKDTKIGIHPSRPFSIKWGKLDLDTNLLGRVIFALALLPSPFETEKQAPFSHYLTALSFIAKSDEQHDFTRQAANSFNAALRMGITQYEGVSKASDTDLRIGQLIEEYLGDPEDKSILRSAYQPPDTSSSLRIDDLGHVKMFCDIFFWRALEKLDRENRNAEEVTSNEG